MNVKMIFEVEIDESTYPYLTKGEIRRSVRKEERGTLADYLSDIIRVQLEYENAMTAAGKMIEGELYEDENEVEEEHERPDLRILMEKFNAQMNN